MLQFSGFIPRLNDISGIRTLFEQWWGLYDVISKEGGTWKEESQEEGKKGSR